MLMLILRIALGAALFIGGIILIDRFFDTRIMAATAGLLLWFWQGFVELLARAAGTFSASLAATTRTLAQRILMRRFTRFLLRLLALGIALSLLGRVHTEKIEAWLNATRLRGADLCKRVLHWKPEWPRSIRATIALLVIGTLVWLFLWISENIGDWWGLGASIVFWEVVKHVRIIGLDALISWTTEKWAPVKRFIDCHPWLRWLWLGPLFAWLAQSLEHIKGWHGQRNRGKSSWRTWREKRRARRVLERSAL